MNILIPHSWLLEHLKTDATTSEIQKLLSLSGPSIERIYEIENESVYDIEITTNRVDSMSVMGVAREAAVILSQSGISAKLIPETKAPSFMTKPQKSKSLKFPLPRIINEDHLCGRIMCMVISNVKRNPSPDWMQKRLAQVGLGTHDCVIDITNYVTHDLGHPCHAFDYDKIMKLGGVIKVTKATKGKKFTTLDNIEYETVGGEVIFENNKGEIIDLPGIKGTANSAIDAQTKNVLFWIESVEPKLIRFASMTHAIRTVAAQMNEKAVDPHLALPVFAKGVALYQELAEGKPEKDTFYDSFPMDQKLKPVTLPLERINAYLGLEINTPRVIEILKLLGCEVKLTGKRITVAPPSWRPDITIAEDVIEEIARIYGYHNLPSVLMTGQLPVNRPEDTDFTLEHETKLLLATLGGYDLFTYSMIDETKAMLETKYLDLQTADTVNNLKNTHVKIKNPLTDDMTYLRRTLWTSHQSVLEHQSPDFVFELANVYIPAKEDEDTTLPHEVMRLTLTSKGDSRRLKGALDAILRSIYLPPAQYQVVNPSEALIQSGEHQLGSLLLVPSGNKTLVVIDLNWKTIVLAAKKYPQVKSIPKVAPIIEDMTFTLPSKTYVQDIINTIKSCDTLIDRIEFKEQYQQNATFTIYYQPQAEMNGQEILPIRQKIVNTLVTKYSVKFIGGLIE